MDEKYHWRRVEKGEGDKEVVIDLVEECAAVVDCDFVLLYVLRRS